MKLVILDRDGVLNQHVVNADHGTVDSPLHPDQVVLEPGAAQSLAALTAKGFVLAIASNQPAAAKGKTTLANLDAVNARVVALLEQAGARISSSHLCRHRAEDGCACRKPKPGLLQEALARHPLAVPAETWMVGDGVTDVEAGWALGLKTALIGTQRCDGCRALEFRRPDYWGTLEGFVAAVVAGT
jgi:D-glycero-D-manno-heptose 1,7-bisphosphate phosphatase